MHKRRADMLENTLNELNPQYYLAVCKQLAFELGARCVVLCCVVVLCCAVLCCAVLRFVLLCCVIVCTCVCVALRPARLTHVTAVELTGGVFRDMMDLKLSKFDTANPDGKLALKINKLCVCISTSCFAPPPHPHTCVHSLSCCPFSLPLRLFDGTKQRTKVNRILPQVHRCVITYDCVCV